MKVCVVGADARAHVLADILSRNAEVVVSPGRAGVPNSTDIKPENIEADLFVISPEQPLVDGLADTLRKQGKAVFGPGADGAMLEGSKEFMKQVLDAAKVPTAPWVSGAQKDISKIEKFIKTHDGKVAVKTDGLAAGKGVGIFNSVEAAMADVQSKLSGEAFGDAGKKVVVEALLPGTELSVFVATDGKNLVLFEAAQDFKRLKDNDKGPNTGGMGSFSPVPGITNDFLQDIVKTCIQPVLNELNKRGIEYRGFLYCGLMLTPDGPKVLEYNVRFGDPEAQVVLPRLDCNFAQFLLEAATDKIKTDLKFSDDATVDVVIATEGYAEDGQRIGDVITGIDEAEQIDGVKVYFAGTAQNEKDELITNGGRVLSVVGRGKDTSAARHKAYDGAKKIKWRGMQYRSDIGPKNK